MELLQSVDRWEPVDITEAELDKAVRPIKAFLTKMTKSPYPYGGSAKQAASAVTLKNWIEEYLKTTRADLSRRLI